MTKALTNVPHVEPNGKLRNLLAACRELGRPDAFVELYILHAASRDPRYLPLLPIYFTLPEEDPTADPTAVNSQSLSDAEITYPMGLQHFFNGAFRVDPQGISPFIPYIIRSDLGRILGDAYNDVENDLGDSGTLDDIASPRDAPINIASGPGDPPAMSTRGDEHLKWPAITGQDNSDFSRDSVSGVSEVFAGIVSVILAILVLIVAVVAVFIMAPYVDVS